MRVCAHKSPREWERRKRKRGRERQRAGGLNLLHSSWSHTVARLRSLNLFHLQSSGPAAGRPAQNDRLLAAAKHLYNLRVNHLIGRCCLHLPLLPVHPDPHLLNSSDTESVSGSGDAAENSGWQLQRRHGRCLKM